MVKACRVKLSTKTNKSKRKFVKNVNNVDRNVNISNLNMESGFVDMNINVTTSAVDINVNMEKTVDFNLIGSIKISAFAK